MPDSYLAAGSWLFKDIPSLAVPTAMLSCVMSLAAPWTAGRVALMSFLSIDGHLLLMTAMVNSSFVRAMLIRMAMHYRPTIMGQTLCVAWATCDPHYLQGAVLSCRRKLRACFCPRLLYFRAQSRC
jgi:hypothetical protein